MIALKIGLGILGLLLIGGLGTVFWCKENPKEAEKMGVQLPKR